MTKYKYTIEIIQEMIDSNDKLDYTLLSTEYPNELGRKVILRLINDYRPDVLVVEKTFFANNRNSSLLNVFVDEIKAIGKRKGLRVISYAPNTVKKIICGDGRASKEDLAKVIVSKYPELKVYLIQDRKWKERYHQNMFDAVALGVVVGMLN